MLLFFKLIYFLLKDNCFTEFCCFRGSTFNGFRGGSDGKESACNAGDLGQEDPLEKEMTTRSGILAWRIPWTEDPDGLQSIGLHKSQTQLSD